MALPPWPPVIDDDGTGTTGTVLNDAFFDQIKAYSDAAGATSVISHLTPGTVDLVGPAAQIRVVRAFPQSGDITIRSVSAGNPGDLLVIQNIASQNLVWLSYLAGAAGTQLTNIATSAPTPLAPRGAAIYQYDASGAWFLIAHEQGDWISVPFSASNFVGSGSLTWTVAAGNVLDQRYFVRGKQITIALTVSGSTTTGSSGTGLTVFGWPFQFVSMPSLLAISSVSPGWGMVMAAATNFKLDFNRTDFASFPANAGAVYLYFAATVRIN